MSRNDKRAAICRLAFLALSKATIRNTPGNPTIQVRGTFTQLPISSGEFEETETNGEPVEQKLEAVITDTSVEKLSEYRTMLAEYGLLLLTMTNGDQRVVGTDEFPVLVTTELSGTPQALALTFKRNSPEPAKKFSSF